MAKETLLHSLLLILAHQLLSQGAGHSAMCAGSRAHHQVAPFPTHHEARGDQAP